MDACKDAVLGWPHVALTAIAVGSIVLLFWFALKD